MNSDIYIMCVGKIVGGEIDWDLAPLPVYDDVDAAFDAEPTCSFYAHLFPCDGELQRMIDEGEAASNRFGDMLRAMIGDDDDRYDGSIEEDQDWIRGGC